MRQFLVDRSGQFTVALAICLPVLGLSAGGAIDYVHLAASKSALQAAADGAALNAAKELRLAGAQRTTITAMAKGYVASALPDVPVVFSDELSEDETRYAVRLSRPATAYVLPGNVFGDVITAEAEARVYGGAPVCLLGLQTKGKETLSVDKSTISAAGCAVYSNSSDPKGVVVKKGASVDAAFVCSAGGASNAGTVTPKPRTDCPVAPDPLRGRAPPLIGACDHQATVAIGIQVLSPGTYCGGLTIAAGAAVTFMPGTFVVKDGPFKVEDGASVEGVNAGFFLTGTKALIDIASKTSIRFTAPKEGPLAGMLFYEDPMNVAGVHKINSRDASVLLGTFYLPASTLEVGAPGGYALSTDTIGAQSSWTIVVAKKITISDGLNLVLNADYEGASVPAPDGFGMRTSVSLTK